MAKKNQTPPKTFEDALAELETILSDIEGGQVGLEQSLVKYERGSFLIQHCRGILSKAGEANRTAPARPKMAAPHERATGSASMRRIPAIKLKNQSPIRNLMFCAIATVSNHRHV